MKKIILFVSIMILSLSAATSFANTPDSKSDNGVVPVKNEIKLSGEDFNRLSKPDREIRKMDKNDVSVQEGHRRRRGGDVVVVGEHRRSGGVVYIGGGTILLIILIILIV
jgi:hypothetical protein